MLRLGILSIALTTALSSCAGFGVHIATPDLIPYETEVKQRAAQELREAGPPCPRDVVIADCSAVHRMIKDYGLLRDQIRVLRKEGPPLGEERP